MFGQLLLMTSLAVCVSASESIPSFNTPECVNSFCPVVCCSSSQADESSYVPVEIYHGSLSTTTSTTTSSHCTICTYNSPFRCCARSHLLFYYVRELWREV